MKELYQSTDKCGAAVDEVWMEDQNNKQKLTQLWERCAAFANGNQQEINNNSITSQISGSNFFISRYQDNQKQMFTTNEIEPIMRTLVSYMTKSRPSIEVFPANRDEDSQYRAKLAERVHEAKYDLDREQHNSRVAAHYALTFGTVFRKDYWDLSAGADAEVPVFDELGNEVIDPNTGQVQTQQQKTGDNNVAILTPMSMGFDWSVSEISDQTFLQETYLLPVDVAKEMFDRQEPGYTGKAADLVAGGDIGNSLTVLEQLKYATPYSYGSATKIITTDKVLVVETYIRPNAKLPKGRLIIRISGNTVYDSFYKDQDLGSPYFMPYDDVMWHPYTMFRYSEYVGRFLGKGLVETLMPQQMRLNEINGAILQNANTLAKTDILAAENQLQRGVINGNGANIYTFKPSPSGFVPTKWAGVPLPPQFFNEKKELIDQMVREAGTNFVMQGQTPTGVSAASAIEMLLENATQQMSDMMLGWVDFNVNFYTKKLRIIRNFNKFPNDKLVNYLRAISKDALEEEIEDFTGEDIGEFGNVKIEPNSMFPKSEKSKRDMVMQMVQGPMQMFIAEDSPRGARLRKDVFEQFGIETLELDENSDVEKAKWENERMKKMKPVEVWDHDNHPIHLSCHVSEAKKPTFLERASDQVKEAYFQHISAHEAAIQQAQMQQMQQQMQAQQMMGPPPGMQGPQRKQLEPPKKAPPMSQTGVPRGTPEVLQ